MNDVDTCEECSSANRTQDIITLCPFAASELKYPVRPRLAQRGPRVTRPAQHLLPFLLHKVGGECLRAPAS